MQDRSGFRFGGRGGGQWILSISALLVASVFSTGAVIVRVPEDVTLPPGSAVGPNSTGAATATSECADSAFYAVHSVWLNELHYDNVGRDEVEFVEVAGPAGTDLSVWKLVLYNGESGCVYDTIHLSGVISDQQLGFGAVAFDAPGLQNGLLSGYVRGDGIALVMDPWEQVAEFISYEGDFTAEDGPAAGMMTSNMGVAESDSGPLGESLQLAGTLGAFAWVGSAPQSRGLLNSSQNIPGRGGAVVLSYHDVFIPGDSAPVVNITRIWKAWDTCGEVATLPQRIQVADTTRPHFTYVPESATLSCDHATTPAETGGPATAQDDSDNRTGLGSVWINELHYDGGGAAENEFVEIAGETGSDLTGFALAYYDSSGLRYGGIQTLSGVIASGASVGVVVVSPKSATGVGLQNGPADGLALVHLPSRQVIQFISYEGTLTAINGPASGVTSTDIGPSESSATGSGSSIQMSGAASNWRGFVWTSTSAATPGSLNPGQDSSTFPIRTTVRCSDSEEAHDCQRAIRRTWVAADRCGNTEVQTQLLTLADSRPPQILDCPSGGLVHVDQTCVARIPDFLSGLSAADDCTPSERLVVTQTPPPGTPMVPGESILVQILARDECGHVSQPCLVSIWAPPGLSARSEKRDASCHSGVDGAITVWVNGGTPPYEGSLDQSEFTLISLPITVTELPAGEHIVTLRDANGCTAVTSQVIGAPPPQTAWITANGPTAFCAGGSVGLEASPGVTFLWSTGATGPAITVTETGSYRVLVTDENGCSASSPAVAVLVRPLPSATITPSGSIMLCPDQVVTLSASSGESYAWSTGETSQSILVQEAGRYQVVVSDPDGCPGVADISIGRAPHLAVTAYAAAIACQDDATTIVATAEGGNPPYAYRLDTSQFQTSGLLAGVGPGSYTITVRDGGDCTAVTTLTVAPRIPLSLELTLTGETCPGAKDGAINGNAHGGVEPYRICLNDGEFATCDGSFTFVGLASGPHRVTVRDAQDCTETKPAMLETSGVIVHATPLQDQSVCANETASFTTMASGEGPFTFNWKLTANSEATETEYSVTTVGAVSSLQMAHVKAGEGGLVTVLVEGPCGTAEQSASLRVLPHAGITKQPADQIVCLGERVELNVETVGEVQRFRWCRNGEEISGATFNNLTVASFSSEDAGVYEVSAVGRCGSASVSFSLALDSIPPQIILVPADRIVAAYPCQAIVPQVTMEVAALDDCTPAEELRITQFPAAGELVARGETIVFIVVRDAAGNEAHCETRLNVVATMPTVSIGDVSVQEGDLGTKNASFVITLSSISCDTVQLEFATAGSTAIDSSPEQASAKRATALRDYTPVTGTLVFAPGETIKSVAVPVLGDTLCEEAEIFALELSAASNATIVRERGVATIVDDDPWPRLDVEDLRLQEGSAAWTPAVFGVRLSAESAREVTVRYATESGTARAFDDFQAADGVLRFGPAGGDEGNSIRPAATITRKGDQVLVAWPGNWKDCELECRESLSDTSQWSRVAITASLANGQHQVELPIDERPRFYRIVALGDPLFFPGETIQTITVPVVGDTIPEPEETFYLILKDPTGAVLGQSRAAVTILDDDRMDLGADVAILAAHDNPEIQALRSYLAEINLVSVLIDPQTAAQDALNRWGLILCHDPGKYSGDIRELVIDLCQAVHEQGLPLYFVGEGLASWSTNLTGPSRSRWSALTHLLPSRTLGGNGVVAILPESNHRVINGRFGLVESFSYSGAIDATTRGDADSVRLGCSGTADVLVAYEDELSGARVITQNVLATSGSDPASLAERKRLFLNGVWWLLRRPICGLTDLAVSQDAAPGQIAAGEEIAYAILVQRAGECEATGVQLVDQLPRGAQFISAWSPQGTWMESSGTVAFRLGMLEKVRLELMVTVRLVEAGEATNIIRIRGNEREPNLENNNSELTILVLEKPPSPPEPGMLRGVK